MCLEKNEMITMNHCEFIRIIHANHALLFFFSLFFGFIITTGLETSEGKLHLDFSKCMAKSPRQNDNDMLAARLIYSCLHGHTDAGTPLGLSK